MLSPHRTSLLLALVVIVVSQDDEVESGDAEAGVVRQGKAIQNNEFPSIQTFINLEAFDKLRTPEADLSPTNFYSTFKQIDSLAGLPEPNLKEPAIVGVTPESFSLPQLPVNLEEPEIVRSNPNLFPGAVPGSDPNLFSTAGSVIAPESVETDDSVEVSEAEIAEEQSPDSDQLPLQQSERFRRSDLIFWRNLGLIRDRQLNKHPKMKVPKSRRPKSRMSRSPQSNKSNKLKTLASSKSKTRMLRT